MSTLAIDVGSTGVTAVVISTARAVVARGHEALGVHSPRAGCVELAPDGLLATLEACRAAVAQVEVGALRGIGIARGDRRTTALCARLRDAGQRGRSFVPEVLVDPARG